MKIAALPNLCGGLLFVTIAAAVGSEESKSPEETFPANDPGTGANPIRCDRPAGERWYLSRLLTMDGERLGWSRLGSGGGNEKDGHIVDIYESENGDKLLLDMYHPQFIEISAPAGFRLLFQWSRNYEYIDGKLHKLGGKSPFAGEIDEEKETGDNRGDRLIVEVRDGIIQGSVKRYYPGGEPRMEIEYGKANHPDGEGIWYQADGSVLVRYTFREGVLHGPFEYYPDDGSPEMKGAYESGVMKKDEEEEEKAKSPEG